MDIADKIIEALREKYRPLGIAVYGSFADGSNNRNSDFDALLLLPDVPRKSARCARALKSSRPAPWRA